ncbi:MAG: CPBP family intramembrane metalloprotease [Flavobacteriales bacterium]|jgi:membrane protease YdiL (CAAX protease family)|uniref:CPBP family intramembrane glutamic endopeptidase n=1 Tax=Candidatus Ulvibacter alkanivorans TaxID=2267620 RepID=UPI000DF2AA47|nr:CPBP family intramembrane glutamic endopeptidase [Candidatus Ulvibacter alkanivorans]MCH2488654.1 CPBP family intramembrane metalloprotease [Flavobacteriales bacterium]
MYIAQAFRFLNDWWRYLVGAVIIFLASQFGAIPFIGAVAYKLMSEGKDLSALEDPNKLMTVLDSNLTLFLMLLSFAIGLAVLILIVKYLHNQSMRSLTTARKKTDWGRIWFGFLLIVCTTVVLTTIDYYTNPDSYVLQFDLIPFLILAVIAIIMVPLQTSFEEYLFRGYLMQGIGVIAKNRWLPLVITSVIFGGLHFFNPEVEKLGNIIMVYYIGTGFFLGVMTLMDEGMELALGFHAGNNLITALLVTADWTVFQTNSVLKDVSDPSAGFDVLIPVLIVYPIFLAIMAWRYKWSDWKYKLFGKVVPPPQTQSTEIP